MKLAAALAQRADIQKKLNQLQGRALTVIRVQEGDIPDENPESLIAEFERLSAELEVLIQKINHTNSVSKFNDELTIADAITQRDVLQKRQQFYSKLADASAARTDRYSHTEIRFVSSYPTAQLREKAEEAAIAYRFLDMKLQELNWSVELLED